MIKTVKQACRFNPVIQDYRMSQGIENLADLIHDAGDGREFFSRNFVTHGMEQLFREGLLRLSGKSDQAVFELTQAMGGGKTHMMIALGLLARHPHLRPEVRLPPKSGALSLVENIDKELRDDTQAGACAVHARVQDGGGAPGAGWPSHCRGGQGLGHTQSHPGQLGSPVCKGRFERGGC